ncbi:hypothetical protein DBIPINDM_008346 (plasmid) [Mesorhizobium sp. AR02]|uniref:hypothetical protein n=1 Tax=Mesorhizobium sp. AR02 TaxID=2865837 RepID=UPI00215E311D|nr:hypothetical protein [Mesorhizobium sp. AR02]UVK57395.1 hypothetical protein DBIPINDM_008346 [Mesorhizobium sp. AR02]
MTIEKARWHRLGRGPSGGIAATSFEGEKEVYLFGTFWRVHAFLAGKTREVSLTGRRVDKEKFERADREARNFLNEERLAREAKTARLREQRLALQVDQKQPRSMPTEAVPPKRAARRIIEVD